MKSAILPLLAAGMIAAPVLAQTQPSPNTPASASSHAPATPSTTAVTVGAQVIDGSGNPVGTIESVANGNATVNTGTVKAAIPLGSFAARGNAVAIAMTKAQLEAAVAGAKPAEITVGTQIMGPQGNPVGTVDAVTDDLVTVATPNTKVQIPKKAFSQGADGKLRIGMTVDQLEAAAKAAGTPSGGH